MAVDDTVEIENKKLDGDDYKAEGNAAFKKKEFETAILLYSKAIDCGGPNLGVYYNNRGSAHFQLESYGAAITDATAALKLKFWKGYYRRGCAKAAMGRLKEALKDFKRAAKKFPKSKDIQTNVKECAKAIRVQKFLEAIKSDEKLASESINLDSFKVSESYAGPKMPDDGPDVEWVKAVMDWFKEEKTLPKRHLADVMMRLLPQLQSLPNMVDVDVPEGAKLTVCGDTHGQYYDLLHIFEMNGLPSKENPYIFNGDFVDRGSFSCEVIITLFCWKVACPEAIHLTRGNHEGINMNTMYGFKGEVDAKYKGLFDLFTELFNWLPLCYRIQKKVLVLHGGLFSKDGITLKDILAVDRNQQIPDSGIMCEMLWSDPQEAMGRAPSKRGVGTMFGPDVTKKFCDENGLDFIIRSHEMKQDGHQWMHDKRCLTIFSAPNYIDQMGNQGAFICFKPDLTHSITKFDAVKHPNVKPMQYATNPLMQMMMNNNR